MLAQLLFGHLGHNLSHPAEIRTGKTQFVEGKRKEAGLSRMQLLTVGQASL